MRSRLADWFGLNRATVAVLAVIGCLGLSEELFVSGQCLGDDHVTVSADDEIEDDTLAPVVSNGIVFGPDADMRP